MYSFLRIHDIGCLALKCKYKCTQKTPSVWILVHVVHDMPIPQVHRYYSFYEIALLMISDS